MTTINLVCRYRVLSENANSSVLTYLFEHLFVIKLHCCLYLKFYDFQIFVLFVYPAEFEPCHTETYLNSKMKKNWHGTFLILLNSYLGRPMASKISQRHEIEFQPSHANQ